jgi:uncharacterized protein (DUF2147 family)
VLCGIIILLNAGFMKATLGLLNKEMVFISLLCMALMVDVSVWAAEADSIVGVWNSEDKDAKIEIFNCGGKHCGKIVWMDEPCYSAADKEGRPGDLKLDTKNPDPALRTRPILGLQILRDFTFDGKNRWEGGKVYDPESGNLYSAAMSLISINQLHLRGFIVIPLFGRTTTWTRAIREQ